MEIPGNFVDNTKHFKPVETETGVEAGARASDVLVTEDDIFKQVDAAIDDGMLTTRLAKEGERSNLYVSTKITPDEVDSDQTPLDDYQIQEGTYKPAHEIALRHDKRTDVEGRVKDAIKGKIRQNAAVDAAPFYLVEPNVSEVAEAEDAHVSQAIEFAAGDNVTEVINFSERPLDEVQIEEMRSVFEKVVGVAGSRLFETLKGIAILPHDSPMFGDKGLGTVLGTARTMTGTVILNEALFDRDREWSEKFDGKMPLSRAGITFTHELGHIVQAFREGVYQEATGWQNQNRSIVDDYGNVVEKNAEIPALPAYKQEVFTEGDFKEVVVTEMLAPAALHEYGIEPPTSYGRLNSREDFAESFVPFVHDEGNTILDPVRQNAITNTLMKDNENHEHGPFFVKAREVSFDELKTKKQIQINPKEYALNLNYQVEGESPTDRRSPHSYSSGPVVDDYGNLEKSKSRRVFFRENVPGK